MTEELTATLSQIGSLKVISRTSAMRFKGARRSVREIGRALADAARGKAIRISGPAPAPIERLAGRWRFQTLVRAADRPMVLSVLDQSIPERPLAGTQVAVDVDPQDLM